MSFLYKRCLIKRCLILTIFLSCYFLLEAQNNPVANKSAVVTTGKARFTVLTPGLIRVEWDSTGIFEDSATQVVINRYLKKPAFTVQETNEKLSITTEKLQLEYLKNNQRFSATNLTIVSADNHFTWTPDTKDTGNLKGTSRTLDNYNGDVAEADHKNKLQLEDGLLSTCGWFLLDDAQTYLLDNTALPWVKERRSYTSQDFYFCAYGTDYKTALYEYTLITGKVPLPPRYAFGYWWSRYYAYSDNELRTLVNNFEKNNVPLDVLVIDMDWHPSDDAYKPNPRRDLAGSRRGWTGYSWNTKLFPDPAGFLQWTEAKNLKVTLNLHPASGIPFTEEKYPAFAKIMNFDTTGATAKIREKDNPFAKWPVFDSIGYKDITYGGSDKKFMNALFDVILHPLEKQGVDFWWLDWQQYKNSRFFKNLDNVWWLNHVFFLKMQQQTVRPLIYHRWGGLGNHRYQIGFSGDASITWKMLGYEPYFTTTAANVLYGYWSHDIGGHIRSSDSTENPGLAANPELYTRWVQYGVFSPILRTHSTQGVKMRREPWEFSTNYRTVISKYINLRYTLAPYIYTMARKTYDSGISLCRPLYYDHPATKEAYNHRTEYFFGDDMLISPIGDSMQRITVAVKTWLPQGDWVELFSGTRLTGNQTVERHYALDEYPVFIKAGSIIPAYPFIRNLKRNCDTILLKVYGKGSAQNSLYEDAGNDDLYRKGAYTIRKFSGGTENNGKQFIKILPAAGSFAGMAKSKSFFVELYGAAMPATVKVNGKIVPFSATGDVGKSWCYLAEEVAVRIKVPAVSPQDSLLVEVEYPKQTADLNGLAGKMKKAAAILAYMRANLRPELISKEVSDAGMLALNISYASGNYNTLVNRFLQTYNNIGTLVSNLDIDPKYKSEITGMLRD